MSEILFREILDKLCKVKGKKLKQVARETEIPYTTLYTWRQSSNPGDLLRVRRLASYFDVSMEYLLFGEEVSGGGIRQIPKGTQEKFFEGIFEVSVKKLD